METLHALLIHPYPGQMNEAPRELGWVIERLPSLPELLVARFFRSQGEAHTYLILTTWNPETRDALAAEPLPAPDPNDLAIHQPERIFRLTLPTMLEGETEEWLLRYTWGYSRSSLEA